MPEAADGPRDRFARRKRLGLLGVAVAVAIGVGAWGLARSRGRPGAAIGGRDEGPRRGSAEGPAPGGAEYVIDNSQIDDGGFEEANRFLGPIGDPSSLSSLRRALTDRGPRGLSEIGAAVGRAASAPGTSEERDAHEAYLRKTLGMLLIYRGRFAEADAAFASMLGMERSGRFPPRVRDQIDLLRGVIALRRGEVENCIECAGPSSCTFPIVPEATYRRQAGSREAIARFSAYLRDHPGDVRARWLLNLAHMTLGEHPAKVPPRDLVPTSAFRSRLDVGHFANGAAEAGLNARGPNLAGGSVFDDFTGDGRPDLLTTSLDDDRGASLLVNRGDGTFEDRSAAAGLDPQVYALNLARADFDNDGDLDVLLLRGAWQDRMRMSLLRNEGGGSFRDVTLDAGLGEPISSESAGWADYDNDGLVDLFVCGECRTKGLDPKNCCRLYHNKGDGTFEDVAAAAGVKNFRWAKGCAWGDYDGDGRPDLFVSNREEPCRLYHNRGDGTFEDVAPAKGITGAYRSFACGFWDYDNDGRPDLLVSDYSLGLAEEVALILGHEIGHPSGPRLYRNRGDAGFRDVTAEVGLDPAISAMGVNFGDVDNDGDLDLYFGTGSMSYAHLVPNRMIENVAGERFEDVTTSSGTGHLQKGHGVSFADYDGDGDLDLFVEAGGAVPGDRSYNLLYRNPGHGRGSVRVKLVGVRTNRSALGAHIRAAIDRPGGARLVIHRTIGDNMSFGGNPLTETLGLAGSDRVAELVVTWPTSRTSQAFRDIPAGSSIEITEGKDAIRVLSAPKAAPGPGARADGL